MDGVTMADTDTYMASIRATSIAKFNAADRGPFVARSASDRTDDWPRWFVADRNGINVVEYLAPELAGRLPLVPRIEAERLAGVANG
jgi:hypothetical protein